MTKISYQRPKMHFINWASTKAQCVSGSFAAGNTTQGCAQCDGGGTFINGSWCFNVGGGNSNPRCVTGTSTGNVSECWNGNSAAGSSCNGGTSDGGACGTGTGA